MRNALNMTTIGGPNFLIQFWCFEEFQGTMSSDNTTIYVYIEHNRSFHKSTHRHRPTKDRLLLALWKYKMSYLVKVATVYLCQDARQHCFVCWTNADLCDFLSNVWPVFSPGCVYLCLHLTRAMFHKSCEFRWPQTRTISMFVPLNCAATCFRACSM